MYRLMQPEDKPAILALWQSQRKESEEFARKAIEQFAGEQNVYVAEENGEIAAVIINDEATLKRVYFDRKQARLQLVAENPAYPPLVYVGEELETVHILGKAIAFMSLL